MKKARFTYIVFYYVSEGVMVESPRKYHSKDAVLNNLYRYKHIAQVKTVDNVTGKIVHSTAGCNSILNYLSK